MAARIGMILDNDFPPDSRVENEAVSLIKAGFEVFLFSLSYKKGLPSNEEISGIKVVRYQASNLIYKLSALAYTVPFYHQFAKKKISQFLHDYQIDIIHVHDMQIARAVWWANSNDLPIVLDLHENRPEIMKQYRHVNTLQGKLLIHPKVWARYQEKYIRKSKSLVVVTHQAKEEVVSSGLKKPDDVVVVPNTIHKDIFLNYPIDTKVTQDWTKHFNIVYVGDTGLRRGTDTAIAAISLLKERIPEIRLTLIGSNKEDVVLKELTHELKLHNHVFFKGWQDVSLFPSYIAGADICLSPLKRNKHHDTTYANKIFQYMAMGKALVVSDCPPQAEIVVDEKVGLVHLANDPEDLAEKILTLYENQALTQEMGKNARRAIEERWNWEITSRGLLSLYQKHAENNE